MNWTRSLTEGEHRQRKRVPSNLERDVSKGDRNPATIQHRGGVGTRPRNHKVGPIVYSHAYSLNLRLERGVYLFSTGW